MMRTRVWVAGAFAMLLPTMPAGAASGRAPVDIAVAPEQAWQAFLAEGTLASAYDAYGALEGVGYSAEGIDPARCVAGKQAVSEAINTVPVGIALRRAAMLCAQALGDDTMADHELAALSALAKLAFSQASRADTARPIRVAHPADIYALLQLGGLEFRYEYYEQLHAESDFPLVVAAWDPDKQEERHFRFDAIDVAASINRDDVYSGFPFDRMVLANGLVKGQAEANDLLGIDLQAVQAARLEGQGKAKVARLSPVAGRGGILSTRVWIAVCNAHPYPGCTDGLVDAILPRAEAHHAIAMAELAYLYHEGMGVEQDQASASALLDAADRIWPDDGATLEYADIWTMLHEGPFPDVLRTRLLAAEAHGNPNARDRLIRRKLLESETAVLDAADIQYLSSPPRNGQGEGYWQLANYHARLEHKDDEDTWTRKAADAGNAHAQADVAFELLENGSTQSDRDRGKALMTAAAIGGNAWAQRYMAYLARRDSQWSDAEKWLLAGATTHDLDSILAIANLYEWERAGVNGKVDRAVEIYTSLASDQGDAGSEARRRLAEMALAGRGMPKDPAKAKSWLLHDAERGDHESEGLLGMGYLGGRFGKIDEGEGVRWAEKAVAGKDEAALVEYGSWLYYTKKTPQARVRGVALWRSADELGWTTASNNLAWALCTAPDPALYDPDAGLAISTRIGQVDALDAPELDTVAACKAATGDFAGALTLQERAIKQVTKSDALPETAPSGEDYDQGYWDRLALYRKQQRYVEQ